MLSLLWLRIDGDLLHGVADEATLRPIAPNQALVVELVGMDTAGYAHAHTPSRDPSQKLALAFVITALIAIVEAVGGHLSGSLALWADAGHMLVDLLALGLAWVTSRTSRKPADSRRTWGYRRIEVLGALVNGLLLLVVALGIALEAIGRWQSPVPIALGMVAVTGAIGLAANLLSLLVLKHHHAHMGVRGALWHVAGDALSSVGVMLTALALYCGASPRIDAAMSFFLSLIIIAGALRLMRDVVDVLLESSPLGIDVEDVRRAMGHIPGVLEVHDLHIWSITSGLTALAAHVVLKEPDSDAHGLREKLEGLLVERFGLEHTTLQIEHHKAGRCGCV